MKIGIIGLAQTGKKTLFQILTGQEVNLQGGAPKPIPGTADILDPRFDTMVEMYAPKKEVRARIDLVLLPRLEQENIARGDIFRDIADMDAVCHVVRAFEDEAIYHPDGSVDPVRDVEMVSSELLMHDQIFVEKRIERIQEMIKKKKDEAQLKELALMERMLSHLEAENPLRLMDITPEEDLLIRSYPFITRKEMILALNVSEEELGSDRLLKSLETLCSDQSMVAMTVSAKVEAEIAMLDDAEEREAFLEDMGIRETALGVLTRLCLSALGLVSFLTVGKDEVRQWLVCKNSPAPVAAGVIHSDLQRGFIRAEVMKYDELVDHGSEAALKKAGKVYVQGKDYIVEDGDILNIRFSV